MYMYVGNGTYWPGVPARDLSDEEWNALPADVKRGCKKLYKKVVKETDDASK